MQLVSSIGLDLKAGAKFNYAQWSGDIDTHWERHKEEIAYFNSSYSSIEEVYIGSNPPKSGDWHDWQEGVRDAPAPIKYKLGTMTDLITEKNFPTNYQPIRHSLSMALNAYCKSIKTCDSPDPDKPFPKPAKTIKHLTKEVGVALPGDKFEDPNEKNPMMRVRQVQIRGKPCGSKNYHAEQRIYNIQFVMSDGVKTMITPKHGDIDCGLLSTWNVPNGDEINQVEVFLNDDTKLEAFACGLQFFTSGGKRSQLFGCDSSRTELLPIDGQLIGVRGIVSDQKRKWHKQHLIYVPDLFFKYNTVEYPKTEDYTVF